MLKLETLWCDEAWGRIGLMWSWGFVEVETDVAHCRSETWWKLGRMWLVLLLLYCDLKHSSCLVIYTYLQSRRSTPSLYEVNTKFGVWRTSWPHQSMHFLLIDGGLHFRILLDQKPEQAHQVHQKVTKSPQMPHPGSTLGSKAKLSLVATLNFSSDPYIREFLPFLEVSQAVDHLSIHCFSYSNLDAACESVYPVYC